MNIIFKFSILIILFSVYHSNSEAQTQKPKTDTEFTNQILRNGFTETLILTNNDSIKLSNFKDKYILLYFWSIACEDCKKNITKINSVYEKYKNKNFMLLGINPTDLDLSQIKAVAIQRYFKFQVCKANRGYEKFFKVNALPDFILIAPEQKSFKRHTILSNDDVLYFFDYMDNKLK